MSPVPAANVVLSFGAILGTAPGSITAAVSVAAGAGQPLVGLRYSRLPGAIVLAAYPDRLAGPRVARPVPPLLWVSSPFSL